MIYDLSKINDVTKFKNRVSIILSQSKTVELTVKKETRTSRQNRALHLYFEFISEAFNDLGLELRIPMLNGEYLETLHTANLVKDYVWRPIQIAKYNIVSTKDLNTEQVNGCIDVISKFFNERGVEVHFPDFYTYMEKLYGTD